MRRVLLLAVVVAALCGVAAGQTKSPSVSKAPSASKAPSTSATRKQPATPAQQRRGIIFNILQEAHAAAEELPSEQRVAILKEICSIGFAGSDRRAMSTIRSKVPGYSPDASELDNTVKTHLRSWSEELYKLADELPGASFEKVDAQTSAVRTMVPVDVKRAMEMLDGADTTDGQSALNQRNYLAIYVFSEMLRQQGDAVIPDLRARAQSMGENGQYPYGAMVVLASNIRSPELVRAIFNDASANFQRSTDSLNSMISYLAMLRTPSVRDKLEPWQVHDAALQIATRLRAEIERERKAYEEGGKMRPGFSLIDNSVRQGLKDVDAELAESLPPLPPYKAVAAKQSVGDVPARAETPAEVKKLKAEFDKTSIQLMEMSEDEIHEGQELRQQIEKGVEQGTELLHASVKDAKEHVPALETAFPPVTDFVQVAARTNPSMALAAVRKVQDSEIRARMLLTVAVGLPK